MRTKLHIVKDQTEGFLPSVVIEYVEARNAYEQAVKPAGSYGFPKQLRHNDPILLRYRAARAELDRQHALVARSESTS